MGRMKRSTGCRLLYFQNAWGKDPDDGLVWNPSHRDIGRRRKGYNVEPSLRSIDTEYVGSRSLHTTQSGSTAIAKQDQHCATSPITPLVRSLTRRVETSLADELSKQPQRRCCFFVVETLGQYRV